MMTHEEHIQAHCDSMARRQRKMIVAGRVITACALTLAAIVAITCLSSCGLITPKCTAEDHAWPRWSQARPNVWGDTILRRKCKACGWIDTRKSNPCGL